MTDRSISLLELSESYNEFVAGQIDAHICSKAYCDDADKFLTEVMEIGETEFIRTHVELEGVSAPALTRWLHSEINAVWLKMYWDLKGST